MIYTMIAIKDLAQNAFGNVNQMPSPAYAIRSFRDEANRAADDNPVYKHADDFELWQLGTFNNEIGVFTNEAQRLARAKDLKEPQA